MNTDKNQGKVTKRERFLAEAPIRGLGRSKPR
jgi:hypothetical protein